MGPALVLVIRLTVPLTILRWPFWGGLLASFADTIDILIFQWFGFPGFMSYHELDKLLDLYYLALEVFVAQRWLPLPRGIASILFAYRLIGVALFEITDSRLMLFIFPNLFELFFLAYAYTLQYRPGYALTARAAAAWLAVLLVPKMAQEYALHYAKLLDHAVAADIIDAAFARVLGWLRSPFG